MGSAGPISPILKFNAGMTIQTTSGTQTLYDTTTLYLESVSRASSSVALSSVRNVLSIYNQQLDATTYTQGAHSSDSVGIAITSVNSGSLDPVTNLYSQTGRIWGARSYLTMESQSDGYATVEEVTIRNYSSFQPLFDTPTSKYGMRAIAEGTGSSTAAYVADGQGNNQARWQYGFVAHERAIVGFAFAVNNITNTALPFTVDRFGNVISHNLAVSGVSTVSLDPVNPLEVATKRYVDTKVVNQSCTISWDGGSVVVPGTWRLIYKAAFGFSVTSLNYSVGLAAGAFTVNVQIIHGGIVSSVSGLGAVVVNSAVDALALATVANNTVYVGDTVEVTITSVTGNPTGSILGLNITRT